MYYAYVSYDPRNLIALVNDEILKPKLPINTYDRIKSRTKLMLGEARSRGWETQKVKDGTWIFLNNGKTVGGTVYHGPSTQSMFARRVSNDKQATKLTLQANNVPTPNGQKFNSATKAEALEYFKAQDRPVVVKPNGGTRGRGVSLNIKDTESF